MIISSLEQLHPFCSVYKTDHYEPPSLYEVSIYSHAIIGSSGYINHTVENKITRNTR